MSAAPRPIHGLAFVIATALVMSQCGGGSPTAPRTVVDTVPIAATPEPVAIAPAPQPEANLPITPPLPPPPGQTSTFVNVLGDTGWCGSPALAPLARLFERFDGEILLAGDLAYPSGTFQEFMDCFDPSFGRFKSRMRAAPGNHDYVESVAANSYFRYFGERSGPNRLGYYSFRAAEWTIFMLNSNVPIGRNSAQYAFVRDTMQQRPTRCSAAVLHHPFDSSGVNGPSPFLRDVWELLYNLNHDVVIAGHDHLYERHAPVDASQKRDDARGIRQFTVGTGGAPLYNRVRASFHSEILISTHGMLRLKLDPALYEWQFLDVNGNVLDRGLNVCH
ncbi:MAG TPA: metallophosphoesterase [Vicinamibacterales bacterium]|nr:metallophosphoesterase [Vicinamibacterales bacterium]